MNKFLKINVNIKPANFVTYFYPETKEFNATIAAMTAEEMKAEKIIY
jgi:hypothetical protein